MNEILVGILVLAVVITAAYLVSLIIELKKTLRSVDTLLKTTEQTLKPTLEELQQTLRNLNNISDNINEVTTDVKTLSGSVKNVGLTIQQVGGVIEDIVSSTTIRALGLRTGIKTGIDVLIKNIFSRKGDRE